MKRLQEFSEQKRLSENITRETQKSFDELESLLNQLNQKFNDKNLYAMELGIHQLWYAITEVKTQVYNSNRMFAIEYYSAFADFLKNINTILDNLNKLLDGTAVPSLLHKSSRENNEHSNICYSYYIGMEENQNCYRYIYVTMIKRKGGYRRLNIELVYMAPNSRELFCEEGLRLDLDHKGLGLDLGSKNEIHKYENLTVNYLSPMYRKWNEVRSHKNTSAGYHFPIMDPEHQDFTGASSWFDCTFDYLNNLFNTQNKR